MTAQTFSPILSARRRSFASELGDQRPHRQEEHDDQSADSEPGNRILKPLGQAREVHYSSSALRMRHHANRLTSITPRMPVPTASGTPNGTSSSNGSSVVVVASTTSGGISSSTMSGAAVVGEVKTDVVVGWVVVDDGLVVIVEVVNMDSPVVVEDGPLVVDVTDTAVTDTGDVVIVASISVVVVEDNFGTVDGDVIMVVDGLSVVVGAIVVVGQCA